MLTVLGERDALVRDAERRAGAALQTMTDDEGLSLREAFPRAPESSGSDEDPSREMIE